MKYFPAFLKIFYRLTLLSLVLFGFHSAKANNYFKQNADSPSLIGRWDMTLYMDGNEYPSWLEVQLSGTRTLVGQYVGTGGSARPISKINFADGKMSFSIPPE